MPIIVAIPKEIKPGELRVALTPTLVPALLKLGVAKIKLEHQAGIGLHLQDEDYRGVSVVANAEIYSESNLILKVQPPTAEEVASMPAGATLISFLSPKLDSQVVQLFEAKGMTALAMELIPRISRAQTMDALSSQATVVGYKAVLLAADHSLFFFPMLTTAAGSIRPAKVCVIGVGVAGLQAIATAKRLGAQVSAYDVRPETKEQVESLGAKFIEVGVQAAGVGGYARSLTVEEQHRQNTVLSQHLAHCDVVITTAGIPGRPAPQILTQAMVENMQTGAVIVDTLAEYGGNCVLTRPGETYVYRGITILGPLNLHSSLAVPASEMYAKNVINFLSLLVQEGSLRLNLEDEIVKQALVTLKGQLVSNR